MALIKGSKASQAGSVVVQGDQVIPEDAKPVARARPKVAADPFRPPDPVVIGGPLQAPIGVPEAEIQPFRPEPPIPDRDDHEARDEASRSSEGQGLGEAEGDGFEPGKGRDMEAIVGVAEPGLLGQIGSDEERDGGGLERWEAARDAVLDAARARAEVAAEEASSETTSPAELYDQLYQESAQRVAQVFGDGPDGQDALEAIVPALERKAAAQAELEAAAAASRARWRELASAEEQIAALLANFDLPESSGLRLLAEREQILSEARLQAARVLAEAHQEAARIRADAEAQGAQALEDFELTRQERLERLTAEARAAGYTEGRAQADEEGARIIEEAIETLNRARLAYPRAVKENQEKLVELALQVAEKIIGEEIAARPELVLGTLETALTRVTDMESVTIRVNPEDLPIVQEKEEQYRDMLSQVKKLEFVASPKIQRGGVFIETSSGTVDATIKTQLSVINEVFRGVQKELEEVTDAESDAFEELDS